MPASLDAGIFIFAGQDGRLFRALPVLAGTEVVGWSCAGVGGLLNSRASMTANRE
ncbi:MAG: hypothetical protein KJ960_17305 [Gammaproteobacteria bacterium]|nr:hypothetical protein [Gammaproteobacteria bacterium]